MLFFAFCLKFVGYLTYIMSKLLFFPLYVVNIVRKNRHFTAYHPMKEEVATLNNVSRETLWEPKPPVIDTWERCIKYEQFNPLQSWKIGFNMDLLLIEIIGNPGPTAILVVSNHLGEFQRDKHGSIQVWKKPIEMERGKATTNNPGVKSARYIKLNKHKYYLMEDVT